MVTMFIYLLIFSLLPFERSSLRTRFCLFCLVLVTKHAVDIQQIFVKGMSIFLLSELMNEEQKMKVSNEGT